MTSRNDRFYQRSSNKKHPKIIKSKLDLGKNINPFFCTKTSRDEEGGIRRLWLWQTAFDGQGANMELGKGSSAKELSKVQTAI